MRPLPGLLGPGPACWGDSDAKASPESADALCRRAAECVRRGCGRRRRARGSRRERGGLRIVGRFRIRGWGTGVRAHRARGVPGEGLSWQVGLGDLSERLYPGYQRLGFEKMDHLGEDGSFWYAAAEDRSLIIRADLQGNAMPDGGARLVRPDFARGRDGRAGMRTTRGKLVIDYDLCRLREV